MVGKQEMIQMLVRVKWLVKRGQWLLSRELWFLLILALAFLQISSWIPVERARENGNPGSFSFLPELKASLNEGDYLFFPNRRNIWAVNPKSGRMIHYKFLDTAEGMVDPSHPGQVDTRLFPSEDTVYMISERNATDLLWVCNRRTGDFQLWRRNVRDGRLFTDSKLVMAGQDLLGAKEGGAADTGEDEEAAPKSSKSKPPSSPSSRQR